MCQTMLLYCTHCDEVIKTIDTSKKVESENAQSQLIDINLRSVKATTAAGGGLASLRRLCTNLNLPEPVTENCYTNYLKQVESNLKANCERNMGTAAKELRIVLRVKRIRARY